MTMRERYGWRDPEQHEWTSGDIAFGWAVGLAVVIAGSIVLGILLAGSAAVIVLVFGVIIGVPALTLYGVPVAIAAATALRRVPSEPVHLAVFGALGALGGLLVALVVADHIAPASTVMPPAIVLGTVTAVLARAFAHHRALRTRGAMAEAPDGGADTA